MIILKKRWTKDWEEEEFPTLEQSVMECMDFSKNSLESMEEGIEILDNLFIAYEKVNEKRKMQWLDEIVKKGRDINARMVVIKRNDIYPEKEESKERFENAVKNGENKQIVITGLFSVWVTFKLSEVLTPTMIENWGLSKKTCSVEYVL